MKRLLLILLLVLPVLADGGKPLPIPVGAADKEKLVEAYKALESVNKDFQIALLRARVNAKVGEDWPIDLQKMEFTPPAAPVEKPKP